MCEVGNIMKATDLARFCEVDLKTIHNWVERGKIDYWRTPGQHLRFTREAVVTFLQKWGYPIPDELKDVAVRQPLPAASSMKARVLRVFENGGVALSVGTTDANTIAALVGREVTISTLGPL